MKPWGHIDWLLSFYGQKTWNLICSSSFEKRSTTLPLYIGKKDIISCATIIRIDDPPNKDSDQITELTNKSESTITNQLKEHKLVKRELMEAPTVWSDLLTEVCSKRISVILDVTTLPKRVALFLLRLLIENKNVADLIVCYTTAGGYTEKDLASDMKPPSALPGFSKIQSDSDDNIVIISVGYSTFNLGGLLEQERSTDVHFLLPFPPASPSFRRNWRFLEKLVADAESPNHVIKRIHAYDMFQVYDWLVGHIWENRSITMLPLGPKPHSIAMALAQLKFKGWEK